MVSELAFSPQWFSGIDIAFEVVGLFVTLLIAIYAYRLYSFFKERRYKFFSLAFFSIAAAFLFKTLTNFTLYNRVLEQHTVGLYKLVFNLVSQTAPFYTTGLLLHRFFMLAGLIMLFFIFERTEDIKKFVLFLYFALITTLFSAAQYFVFHLTAAVFLLFVVRRLYQNYNSNRNQRTALTFFAFLTLLISQLSFIFVVLSKTIYVAAEVIQLAGFVALLINYYLLLKK